MSISSEPVEELAAALPDTDFVALFHVHYSRIARVLARTVGDSGRAEELAADVFWKFLHGARSNVPNPGAWLYRVAIRKGLDELRRQRRREKYEGLLAFRGVASSPEELYDAAQDQHQVRTVLALMRRRDSELLILRSEGMSYQEIAGVLGINSTSVGTLLRRAQTAFRKEYVKRYGQPNP